MSKAHGLVEGAVGVVAGLPGLLALLTGNVLGAGVSLALAALVLHNAHEHFQQA